MEASYEALAASMAGSGITVAKYQADVDKDWAKAQLGLTTFPTIVLLPKGRAGHIKFTSERRDVDTLKMWVASLTERA